MIRRGILLLGILVFGSWAGDVRAETRKTPRQIACEAMQQTRDAPRAVVVMSTANCLIEQTKYASAARLLRDRLDEMDKEGHKGGRAVVENKLQTILTQIAAFEIRTEPGAELLVNGEMVGRYPETNPLFLEPGSYEITVRLGKKEAKVKVDAVAGSFKPLEVSLAEPKARTKLKPLLERPSETILKAKPAQRSRWTTSRVTALAIGGSMGLAGLALGIGFTGTSQDDDRRRAEIIASFPLRTYQCGVLPNLPDCLRVRELVQKRDNAQQVAVGGFVVGGAALVVAMTALVWPSKTTPRDQGAVTNLVTIVPTRDGAELGIVGSF